MSTITVKNNTIHWEILRGVNAYTVINKSTGWAMYDEIRMDFKPEKDIDSFPMLTLTPGNGMTIDGNKLIISVTKEQATVLRRKQIYADIKCRIGSVVEPPIPFLVPIKDTVTKLP